MQPGVQKTSLSDNFHFDAVDTNAYKFSWSTFDPKDYFEAHFLIGTDLDKKDFKNLLQIEGSIVKDITVTTSEFDKRIKLLDGIAYALGLSLGIILLFLVTFIPDNRIIGRVVPARFDRTRTVLSTALGAAEIILAVALGVILGPALSSALFNIPSWAEARVFPPYFLERFLAALNQ
jgi:hypothetical protein